MGRRVVKSSKGRFWFIGVLVLTLVLALGITTVLADQTGWLFARLKSPEWYLWVDDAGYSDEMWQTYPGQLWHENLSGEWAAAIRYQGIDTPNGDAMWFTPLFICPIFETNSTFEIVTPLSTWDDPSNPTVGEDTGYARISNGFVQVDIHFLMHKTEEGTVAGMRAGGTGDTPPMMSGHYILEVTYVVTNISTENLEEVRFFQFLHGQPNDDYGPNNSGVYDPSVYAGGAFNEYHFDITQYGKTYQPGDPNGLDMVGFSSKEAPDGWGMGEYPSPGCGTGEPATGLHTNLYKDTLPNTNSAGPTYIAGAMKWNYDTLAPGESFTKSIILYNGYLKGETLPPTATPTATATATDTPTPTNTSTATFTSTPTDTPTPTNTPTATNSPTPTDTATPTDTPTPTNTSTPTDTPTPTTTATPTSVPGGIKVAIDIKPGSCPNPISTRHKGVVPVAVLGDESFQATWIDPASITFEGIHPLRWSLEDVGSPYLGALVDIYDCHKLGADGYLDLTLKFDAVELAAVLGNVHSWDILILELSGNLRFEYGGTAFSGEDIVRIVRR